MESPKVAYCTDLVPLSGNVAVDVRCNTHSMVGDGAVTEQSLLHHKNFYQEPVEEVSEFWVLLFGTTDNKPYSACMLRTISRGISRYQHDWLS